MKYLLVAIAVLFATGAGAETATDCVHDLSRAFIPPEHRFQSSCTTTKSSSSCEIYARFWVRRVLQPRVFLAKSSAPTLEEALLLACERAWRRVPEVFP
jgi:hypothetical protein